MLMDTGGVQRNVKPPSTIWGTSSRNSGGDSVRGIIPLDWHKTKQRQQERERKAKIRGVTCLSFSGFVFPVSFRFQGGRILFLCDHYFYWNKKILIAVCCYWCECVHTNSSMARHPVWTLSHGLHSSEWTPALKGRRVKTCTTIMWPTVISCFQVEAIHIIIIIITSKREREKGYTSVIKRNPSYLPRI
jgi:hypothetical protein